MPGWVTRGSCWQIWLLREPTQLDERPRLLSGYFSGTNEWGWTKETHDMNRTCFCLRVGLFNQALYCYVRYLAARWLTCCLQKEEGGSSALEEGCPPVSQHWHKTKRRKRISNHLCLIDYVLHGVVFSATLQYFRLELENLIRPTVRWD